MIMGQEPAAGYQEAEAEARKPLILEIKGNSLDDGPGIRTVVFFKGCPLSCVWCHNPESKKPVVEISFDPKLCAGCDTCLDTCAEQALSRKIHGFIDRDRCTLCFRCVETCPSGALSRVGVEMSVQDVVRKILPDKPFFDNSGGGVTLSGGEPTLFMDYVAELLAELKKAGIHTLLETCGMFRFDAFEQKLLPWLDTIYFDIKLMDPEQHRRECGVSNLTILRNFELLLNVHREVVPRTPLIPGITDTVDNVRAIAAFLKGLGVHKACLLPYNPLWFEKCDKIGVTPPFGSDGSRKTWTDREGLARLREIFRENGITT